MNAQELPWSSTKKTEIRESHPRLLSKGKKGGRKKKKRVNTGGGQHPLFTEERPRKCGVSKKKKKKRNKTEGGGVVEAFGVGGLTRDHLGKWVPQKEQKGGHGVFGESGAKCDQDF